MDTWKFFVAYISLVMIVAAVIGCTPDEGLIEDKNQSISFKLVTNVYGMDCVVSEGHIQDSSTNTQFTGMSCNWAQFVPPAVTLDDNTELVCTPKDNGQGLDCTKKTEESNE